ncbi:hypothetical protein EVG20_g1897 [Dentipellis fragilis]|uniref:Uncharacterized protein n=1 Tax=Dentipellis fragilis TaxID=205917 RepID=A0A4Y9ZBE8_9AGAM|nr:hypothetical protein EVG20_g1897 [Dentipellis fragilis]
MSNGSAVVAPCRARGARTRHLLLALPRGSYPQPEWPARSWNINYDCMAQYTACSEISSRQEPILPAEHWPSAASFSPVHHGNFSYPSGADTGVLLILLLSEPRGPFGKLPRLYTGCRTQSRQRLIGVGIDRIDGDDALERRVRTLATSTQAPDSGDRNTERFQMRRYNRLCEDAIRPDKSCRRSPEFRFLVPPIPEFTSMSAILNCSTIIVEFRDALFSPQHPSSGASGVTSVLWLHIISSPIWSQLERCEITQEQCCRALGEQLGVDTAVIEQVFFKDMALLKSRPETRLLRLLGDLKDRLKDRLRIIGMVNIPKKTHKFFKSQSNTGGWTTGIFSHIFTSADAGTGTQTRTPRLAFFRHVLRTAACDAQATAFIDTNPDYILAARSLGLQGMLLSEHEALYQAVYSPACLPAAHLTGDRTICTITGPRAKWNFFEGEGVLTTKKFPCDLDTTSIGLMVLKPADEETSRTMDEMLQYTYFDHERNRIDPVVCVNVLTLFYAHNRGYELARTLHWVRDVLKYRAYLNGTRYYATAECFLYFLSRLLSTSDDAELHAELEALLRARLQERVGTRIADDEDALALAMRLSACVSLGIDNDADLRALLALQSEDGGWDASWIYKYGSSGIMIGNRGVTTALAVHAIEATRMTHQENPPQLISGN